MLMTCRLRLVRRRSHPLGHNSGRAWRGALVRQRPLHRRLVWRRRGLWRRHGIRHALTVVAAIRRLITVLSKRCTDVGVGVGPCYRVQPSLRIPRRRWHVPACTVHAVPRDMGRRGRTPMLRCRSESGGSSGRGVRRRHDCGVFRLQGSFETAAGPLPCPCVVIRHRLCYRPQAPAVMRVHDSSP